MGLEGNSFRTDGAYRKEHGDHLPPLPSKSGQASPSSNPHNATPLKRSTSTTNLSQEIIKSSPAKEKEAILPPIKGNVTTNPSVENPLLKELSEQGFRNVKDLTPTPPNSPKPGVHHAPRRSINGKEKETAINGQDLDRSASPEIPKTPTPPDRPLIAGRRPSPRSSFESMQPKCNSTDSSSTPPIESKVDLAGVKPKRKITISEESLVRLVDYESREIHEANVETNFTDREKYDKETGMYVRESTRSVGGHLEDSSVVGDKGDWNWEASKSYDTTFEKLTTKERVSYEDVRDAVKEVMFVYPLSSKIEKLSKQAAIVRTWPERVEDSLLKLLENLKKNESIKTVDDLMGELKVRVFDKKTSIERISVHWFLQFANHAPDRLKTDELEKGLDAIKEGRWSKDKVREISIEDPDFSAEIKQGITAWIDTLFGDNHAKQVFQQFLNDRSH